MIGLFRWLMGTGGVREFADLSGRSVGGQIAASRAFRVSDRYPRGRPMVAKSRPLPGFARYAERERVVVRLRGRRGAA